MTRNIQNWMNVYIIQKLDDYYLCLLFIETNEPKLDDYIAYHKKNQPLMDDYRWATIVHFWTYLDLVGDIGDIDACPTLQMLE